MSSPLHNGGNRGSDLFSEQRHWGNQATTSFRNATTVSLGIGDDIVNLATAGTVNFVNKVPTFNGSLGTNTKTVTTANLLGLAPVFKNFA